MRHVKLLLRNQLFASANDAYWTVMRLDLMGYTTRTIQELLANMNVTEGCFTEASPLEVTIQQIQETWASVPSATTPKETSCMIWFSPAAS
jgi:hypothetical protein